VGSELAEAALAAAGNVIQVNTLVLRQIQSENPHGRVLPQKVTFERPTRPARYQLGHSDPVNVRRGRLGFIVSHRQHQRHLPRMRDGSGDWSNGGETGATIQSTSAPVTAPYTGSLSKPRYWMLDPGTFKIGTTASHAVPGVYTIQITYVGSATPLLLEHIELLPNFIYP
jgi:hypothetical protein